MKSFHLLIILCVGLMSCESSPSQKAEKQSNEVEELVKRSKPPTLKTSNEVLQKGDLKLSPAEIVKEFPDARLELKSPSPSDKMKAGKHAFTFLIQNYELATQTEGAQERHCANSNQGQHIHFIVNNSPYEAHYNTSFESELMEGNNVVLAFLSRSYHESIKNQSAYVLKSFPIGKQVVDFDESAPHLFYSRPKGEYSGEDAEKILVDFYLVNSVLSSDGNKVELTIDDDSFILDSWQPYFVEGLSEGKHTFRIRLLDADGNFIPGPFNDSGDRIIDVKA